MANRWDVVVVGGGLAGLTAAAVAARAGRRVLLMERGEGLGGRAHTQVWQGFHLNLGAHALFKGGAGWAVLGELGLALPGAEPRVKGRGLRENRLQLLPSGPFSLLASGLFGWREKGAFLALMSRLAKADLEEASGLTCAEWLAKHAPEPRMRQVVGAILRVSAYAGELNRLRAATALRRVRESQKGVFYLHGGWATLVQALARGAQAAGATLRSKETVLAVEPAPSGFEVRLTSGETLEADEVVLALAPADVAALLPQEAAARLQESLRDMRPVKASCLDLCLSRLPHPAVNLGMGIDEPLFMTAQSEAARVAPEGGALVHLLRYHEGRAGEDPAAMRVRMEAFMDLLQPGWRDVLLHARFLPSMTVAQVMDEPGRRRIASDELGLPGLHLAGDWVGDEGWLADASLVSGRRAGLAAAGRTALACA